LSVRARDDLDPGGAGRLSELLAPAGQLRRPFRTGVGVAATGAGQLERAGQIPLRTPMAVIGAGSWGTALAIQCARAGHPTRLWGRDAALVESMLLARRNARYLPDAESPPSLEPVAELPEALAGVRDVLVAVPSHAF